VSIETLDNPGWQVRIDLQSTADADRPFDRQETHRDEDDWLVCWVESERFHAACGPRNLLKR
jgi:Immunity protein 53